MERKLTITTRRDWSAALRDAGTAAAKGIKRVHDDATALAELGLIERSETGTLSCPYVDIHVDMHVSRLAA